MLFTDSFNRADSALSAAGWSDYESAGLFIRSNTMVGNTSGLANTRQLSAVNVGRADVDISCRLAALSTQNGLNCGLVARLADSNNYLRFVADRNNSLFSLQKNVATVFTTLGPGSFSQTPAVGDILRLVCRGNLLEAYVNGILIITAVDSAGAANTRHGMCINIGSTLDETNRLDDFRCAGANPPFASALQRAVMALTPGAYYPMDEVSGSTIRDISGNGRNISTSGSPTLGQSGPQGASVLFDGVDDVVTGTPSSFTAQAWGCLFFTATAITAASGYRGLVSPRNAGAQGLIVGGGVTGAFANELMLSGDDSGNNMVAWDTSTGVITAGWHFVVCANDAGVGGRVIYLDGVRVDNATFGSRPTSAALSTIVLGRYPTSAGYLVGRMCHAFFLSSQVTAADVANLSAIALRGGVVIG